MSAWSFEAIGTHWEIETPHELPATVRERVMALIGEFDEEWSRFRPDSVVSRLRDAGGSVPAPADAADMLDAYRQLDAATDGAINPLVGRSLEALGYDGAITLRAGRPEQAPRAWQSQLRWTQSELTLATPATIDVGALGKGRLVDLVLAALDDIDGRVVVDASGDLAVRGGALRVALEHPLDPKMAVGVATIHDEALCASAINRRAWGAGLHHVLDARTGAPVRTWGATWAIAPDAMHADAIATALFFEGGPDLAARWGVQWVRMTTDGRAERSEGFAGELFARG